MSRLLVITDGGLKAKHPKILTQLKKVTCGVRLAPRIIDRSWPCPQAWRQGKHNQSQNFIHIYNDSLHFFENTPIPMDSGLEAR